MLSLPDRLLTWMEFMLTLHSTSNYKGGSINSRLSHLINHLVFGYICRVLLQKACSSHCNPVCSIYRASIANQSGVWEKGGVEFWQ